MSCYIACVQSYEGEKCVHRLVVPSSSTKTINLLDAKTGEVVKTRKTNLEGISGVTTDSYNNIYISGSYADVICVMSSDLSEERVYRSTNERTETPMHSWPQRLAFDVSSNQLLNSNHQETYAEGVYVKI